VKPEQASKVSMRMPPPPARAGHRAGFCFVAARAAAACTHSAAAGNDVSIATAEAGVALGISVAAAPSALQRRGSPCLGDIGLTMPLWQPHIHRARRGSALHERGSLLSGAASRRGRKFAGLPSTAAPDTKPARAYARVIHAALFATGYVASTGGAALSDEARR
jgi:hypothetical protein